MDPLVTQKHLCVTHIQANPKEHTGKETQPPHDVCVSTFKVFVLQWISVLITSNCDKNPVSKQHHIFLLQKLSGDLHQAM